jgi:LysM repeat protein
MVVHINGKQADFKPAAIAKVRMKINPPLKSGIKSTSLDRVGLNAKGKNGIRDGVSFGNILNSMDRGTENLSDQGEKWIEYTIKPRDTLWALAVKRFHVKVDDLIRDNHIKDPRKIQPGQKIRIRLPSYPTRQNVVASWYGKKYHGKVMANGESFNMYALTIAHKDLPLGTHVELENPATGVKARAVVTDRGPYIHGRDVDLSYGLAKRLSLDKKGIGSLIMRVLG